MPEQRLKALLQDPHTTLDAVVQHLDGLDTDGRIAACEALAKAELVRLYALAAGADPVTIDDFVPPGAADLTPVRHVGWNSIPVPSPFRRFEKRMARRVDADGKVVVVGYNEGITRTTLGPGFFTNRPSLPEFCDRGPWVVDYLALPAGPFPEGWPKLKANEQGLQRFVYSGTRDYMRKVTDGVTIGMPFKVDTCLGMPFTLIRRG